MGAIAAHPSPLFQPATAANAEVLLALVRDDYAELASPFGPAQVQAVERLAAGDPFGRAWIIEIEGTAAGFVIVSLGYSIEYGGRDAFIDELYVIPSMRRRGLGASALAFAEAFCRAQAVTTLHLEVARDNREAGGLYRRAGFKNHQHILMSKALQ